VAVSFIGGGTGVPGENQRPAASQWQTLSHKGLRELSTTKIYIDGSKLDCILS
jgi:hypothetical protein